MRPLLPAVFVLLLPGSPPTLPLEVTSARAGGGCPVATFAGEVSAGRSFQREFGEGLVFRLMSESDPVTPGWTIQIHEKSDAGGERDFLMIATPPYRFWNPRYLNVSYGYSAQESVAIRIREFSFVTDRERFDPIAAALDKTLWSHGHPEQEVKQATAIVLNAPRCSGRLRILDAKIENAENVGGRIAWLKFAVELGKPTKAKP